MRRDVFQAISDPTRREIIKLISGRPLHLNAIAENFDMSRPAISQHIKILSECGLISIRKDGRERYCEPKFRKLKEVSNWVEQYRGFWEQKYNRLDTLLDEMKADQGKSKKKK